jgi:hypothetical protein
MIGITKTVCVVLYLAPRMAMIVAALETALPG